MKYCSICGVNRLSNIGICDTCKDNRRVSDPNTYKCYICGKIADMYDVTGAKCNTHKNETRKINSNSFITITIMERMENIC